MPGCGAPPRSYREPWEYEMPNLYYKCASCGHAISSTARFCTGCRTPGPIARHPNSWRTSEPLEATAELLAAERGTSNTTPDCGAAPYSRSNYARRRVWAALGVVVMVVLAVSLWMLLSATGMITFIIVSFVWLMAVAVIGGLLKGLELLEKPKIAGVIIATVMVPVTIFLLWLLVSMKLDAARHRADCLAFHNSPSANTPLNPEEC